jgi:hypothetical protein
MLLSTMHCEQSPVFCCSHFFVEQLSQFQSHCTYSLCAKLIPIALGVCNAGRHNPRWTSKPVGTAGLTC